MVITCKKKDEHDCMLKKDEHESHGLHEYIIFTRATENTENFYSCNPCDSCSRINVFCGEKTPARSASSDFNMDFMDNDNLFEN